MVLKKAVVKIRMNDVTKVKEKIKASSNARESV
jgi:hypothetical protein